MNAVISGQAGIAILVDGEKLASIQTGGRGEVISRRPEEVRFLLGDARDLEFVEELDVQEIGLRLDVAAAKYDVLHLALILLDETLTSDTRRDAAEELEELLDKPEVADFPERVLCAHPFPRGADPVGAHASCTGRTPRTRDLLSRLESWQHVIAEVHDAWERIPSGLFGSTEDRQNVLAIAVREGLFRNLVKTRASNGSFGRFIEKSLLNASFATVRDPYGVLREWVSLLETTDSPAAPSVDSASVRSEVAEGSRYSDGLRSLRILLISDSLDFLGREHFNPEMALQDVRGIELVMHRDLTVGSLRQVLLGEDYQVLHFIGHGILALHNELAPSRDALFQAMSKANLVVLDACWSGKPGKGESFGLVAQTAHELVHAGIPAVVATQYPLADQLAVAFSRTFYRLLASGRTIDYAVAESDRIVRLLKTTSGDWTNPVLVQRAARRDPFLTSWRGRQQLGPMSRLYRKFRRFWRHR